MVDIYSYPSQPQNNINNHVGVSTKQNTFLKPQDQEKTERADIKNNRIENLDSTPN